MPDVFKLLKDLESKAVGVDPQTQRMTEGYFISFRPIGLPIPKDVYDNPFDPFGGDLARALSEAAAQASPADPSTHPSTSSGQLTPDQIAAANVGKSMMSYLSTFVLTDAKLSMANDYSVMPDSGKVSDAWWAIITGANASPAQAVADPALQKAIDEARAKMVDNDGNPTPHYQAYLQYEDEHNSKVKAFHRAYAAALTDPVKLQEWATTGLDYQGDVDEAMTRWEGLGYRTEIQTASNFLAAQGIDPATALIALAKERFTNSLIQTGPFQTPYTFMVPTSWYDSDNDEGWTDYTSTDFHTDSHYQASSTSYGGGGAIMSGFWVVGGSFDHADQHQQLNIQTNNLDVSFKYCTVDVQRLWMVESLLNLPNWFLVGNYKKGCISTGEMGQSVTPANRETEFLFLPSIVTSLVLIKDLSLRWDGWQSAWSTSTSATSDRGLSIGWGPFAVHGRYAHGSQQRDFSADASGESLQVHGIQLIGYVSTINPLSPRVDTPR